jgi:DNA-binding transcriptional LysR family regulator
LSGVELKHLRYFTAVAERGSFTGAAEQLGVEPSALSRRVRDLEDHLGAGLFERQNSGVRLTEAGRQFYEDVRPVFSHLEAATQRVRAAGTADVGRLRIGIVASIASGFVHGVLQAWIGEHPNVSLSVIEGSPETHTIAILNRELDVAFFTGDAAIDGCDVEVICQEPIFVALSEQHPLADLAVIRWPQLLSCRFIVSQEPPGPEINDYIVKRLSGLGVSPYVERQRVGRETLMAMVGLGLGVSFISGAEAGVRYPGVALVPLNEEPLPFRAVWAPENDNPALRRLLSLARVRSRARALDAAYVRSPDPSP